MAFDGFRHFTSSTASGSASAMSLRTRASASIRQSSGASIAAEEEGLSFVRRAQLFIVFMVASRPAQVPRSRATQMWSNGFSVTRR